MNAARRRPRRGASPVVTTRLDPRLLPLLVQLLGGDWLEPFRGGYRSQTTGGMVDARLVHQARAYGWLTGAGGEPAQLSGRGRAVAGISQTKGLTP